MDSKFFVNSMQKMYTFIIKLAKFVCSVFLNKFRSADAKAMIISKICSNA